jgi:nucleotide-binding universal stress UspA family protein
MSFSKMARRRLHILVPSESDLPWAPEGIIQLGPPVHPILSNAKERSVDLLVMGVRGRGATSRTVNLSMGSPAYKVVSQSPCPVLTVREGFFEFDGSSSREG